MNIAVLFLLGQEEDVSHHIQPSGCHHPKQHSFEGGPSDHTVFTYQWSGGQSDKALNLLVALLTHPQSLFETLVMDIFDSFH